jgi:hypothetical protein
VPPIRPPNNVRVGSVAARVVAVLHEHGPLPRHRIAAIIGEKQSNVYTPLHRRPDLFRRNVIDSSLWELNMAGQLTARQLESLMPTTAGYQDVFPGEEFDAAEAAFLRELAAWRATHRKNFVTPVEVLRLLRAMGWTPPAGTCGAATPSATGGGASQ